MQVIIIGAGVGGLCTATALQNIGIDVTVFEQADEPAHCGCRTVVLIRPTEEPTTPLRRVDPTPTLSRLR